MQFFLDSVVIISSIGIALSLFYGVINQWKNGKKTIKILLYLIFVLCAFGVSIHVYKQSKFNAQVDEFQNAFKHNETLICFYENKEIYVHKSEFIYFSDTFSFIGKNERKGINVNIADCIQHIMQNEEIIND